MRRIIKRKKPFLIAEIGINHNGSLQLAKELIDLAKKYNFDAVKLKQNNETLLNTSYVYENRLIHGPTERIKDVNIIPSPYLIGALDDFFKLPLVPLLETTGFVLSDLVIVLSHH